MRYGNRAGMETTTTGTGTITLGAAVSKHQTFATAGVVNADSVPYFIEDGNAWEIGIGVYSSTGPTLTRVLVESSTGSLLNLSGAAQVYIDAQASFFNDPIAAIANASSSKSTPVDTDEIPLVDSAASNVLKKLTWSNLKTSLASVFGTVTSVNAGVGLSGGNITTSGTMALAINALTADTSPDSTADYLATYDTSATAHKKVLPKDLRPDALSTVNGSAPSYAARAWVKFAGATGTISAGGNVSSVTRNGTGDYTINFSTAMPDANYVVNIGGQIDNAAAVGYVLAGINRNSGSQATSSVRINTLNSSFGVSDYLTVEVVIFR